MVELSHDRTHATLLITLPQAEVSLNRRSS